MEYQRIADELRRKAARLNEAADSIEEVYLVGLREAQDEVEKDAVPERWGPGTGAPPARAERAAPAPTRKPAPAPAKGRPAPQAAAPKPMKPATRRPAAPPDETEGDTAEDIADTFTKNELRQAVHAVKMMLDSHVPGAVLQVTVKNWCAGKGIPSDPDFVSEAIAIAKREAAA